MADKSIELELRAEVSPNDHDSIRSKLDEIGVLHSHTDRLSVMYFGEIGDKKIDIRVRVTNGECETVVKSGSFWSHDRVEVSQKITPQQFMGHVKIFAQFDFKSKVGERETFNYHLPNSVVASLVTAGPIAYVELEIMSSPDEVEANKALLTGIANRLDLRLLESEAEFDDLCSRLDKENDWPMTGSEEDYAKLEILLDRHTTQDSSQAKI